MRASPEVVNRVLGDSQPKKWWYQGRKDGPMKDGLNDDDEWSCVLEDDKIYGDERKEKKDDHIRIGVSNIGCWPDANTVEMEDFKQWAIGGDFDALLLNEIGKNWTAVQEDKKLESIVRTWWMQTYTNKSWLKPPKGTKEQVESQYGGAAVLSNDRLASTIYKSGGDKENLGRWAWTTYRGTDSKFTTVVALYHPCKNKGAMNSVEAQQLERLADKYPGEDHNIFTRYREDLQYLIKSELDSGHQLIIAGDFNRSLRTMRDPLLKMLQTSGLREVILEKQGVKSI